MPITPQDVADQIVAATQLLTDAADASPGKWVHVQVIPGFSPAIPAVSNLTGTLTGALPGALSGVANTFVDAVRVGVKFTVTKDGQVATEGQDFLVQPTLSGNDPCDATDVINDPQNPGHHIPKVPSDPLNLAFLFKPLFAEDIADKAPGDYVNYKITVSLCINVEGFKVRKDIQIPVSMPPIEIPALFLLTKHAGYAAFENNDPGWLLVLVRGGSPLQNLNQVLSAINRVMDLIRTLQALVGDLSVFISELKEVSWAINVIPVVFFHVGNITDMEDLELDDEASASILIGTKSTAITLYESGNFDKGDAYSVFTTNEIMVGNMGTNLGVDRQPSFPNVNWAHNEMGEDMNDSVNSLQWGDA